MKKSTVFEFVLLGIAIFSIFSAFIFFYFVHFVRFNIRNLSIRDTSIIYEKENLFEKTCEENINLKKTKNE